MKADANAQKKMHIKKDMHKSSCKCAREDAKEKEC